MLQSIDESRAKGLQTYTEQQAAKQNASPQKSGTSQYSDCTSQSLRNTEMMLESPSESEADCAYDNGDLAFEEEEEPESVVPIAHCEDGCEEEEMELCLSLSSDEEG